MMHERDLRILLQFIAKVNQHTLSLFWLFCFDHTADSEQLNCFNVCVTAYMLAVALFLKHFPSLLLTTTLSRRIMEIFR